VIRWVYALQEKRKSANNVEATQSTPGFKSVWLQNGKVKSGQLTPDNEFSRNKINDHIKFDHVSDFCIIKPRQSRPSLVV
jgi:hypothetical protein